jgi:pyridine nucleotide-disulfide oxidoreductase
MMNVAERRQANTLNEAQVWLERIAAALQAQDAAAAAELFLPDGLWRDILAFTWTIETMAGRPAIEAALRKTLARTKPTNFAIPAQRTPPRRISRAGTETLIRRVRDGLRAGAFHRAPPARRARLPVRLDLGDRAAGIARLRRSLEASRRQANEGTRDFGAENWLDRRNKARAYDDHEPVVLVIGAGQAGLSIAARLTQLGVDTLIVDRHERVGDKWRKRYHSLTLHNEVYVNHLPYMPFPPNFPVYIPKDRLANWFEAYVDAMELNVWTGTALFSGGYDEVKKQWSVTLRRDGATRVIHPRHLIFATGVSSIPYTPEVLGLGAFKGTIVHSGDFKDAGKWKGRKALVLGSGTSGHDVAQELHAHGADVTIIQRSKTHVVSLKEAQRVYAVYSEGIPFDDCDLLATSLPYPVLQRSYQVSTAKGLEVDKELLDKLAACGFRHWPGEDATGFQMMYLRRGGGYYFNVGCSELIISGQVKLLQFADIDSFVAQGARLKNGSTVSAELLVLATGYKNQQEAVRLYLGDEIADKVGPVWGYGDDGELRNMWRRTAQPGLWFTAGSLAQCRIFSRYLALQIKAQELGLLS